MGYIELSYANIMNCFNKGIPSDSICPTREVARHVFKRALDLWHIEGMTLVDTARLQMMYGPRGPDQLPVRFSSIQRLDRGDWKSFKGIFLFHPELNVMKMSDQIHQQYLQVQDHNTRYLERWQR